MKRKFDKDDVLKFLYGELDPSDTDAFMDALVTDEELFGAFEELKEIQEELDEVELDPSQASIDAVMKEVHTPTPELVPAGVLDTDFSPRPKSPGKGIRQLVSVFMIVFSVFTIVFAVRSYQSENQPAISNLQDAIFQWDDSQLTDHLEHARMHLNNIQGDREAIFPVHHNTYRLVNTSIFSPAAKSVVLLNIN